MPSNLHRTRKGVRMALEIVLKKNSTRRGNEPKFNSPPDWNRASWPLTSTERIASKFVPPSIKLSAAAAKDQPTQRARMLQHLMAFEVIIDSFFIPLPERWQVGSLRMLTPMTHHPRSRKWPHFCGSKGQDDVLLFPRGRIRRERNVENNSSPAS
jgi:hypothetical protein